MNLQQLDTQLDKNSYFSRDKEERILAINTASRFIYDWIIKENQGTWLKWDTSTMSLAAGTEEYTLPADLETLMRMRERLNAGSDWQLMSPASGLIDPSMLAASGSADLTISDGPMSQFSFYGPYLDAAAAGQDPQGAMKVRVGPIPQEARQVELVYAAKYVDIGDTNPNTYLMIPDEGSGRVALLDLATAELVRKNSDSLAEEYTQAGMDKLTLFLSTIRSRQNQQASTQQPFIDDLD